MTERRLRQKMGTELSAQLHICLVSSINVSLLSVSIEHCGFKETKESSIKNLNAAFAPIE